MLQNLIASLKTFPAHPIDRFRHATAAQTVQAMSPGSIVLAVTDWLVHLNMYSMKQVELQLRGADQWLRLTGWAGSTLRGERPAPCIEPLLNDKRFRDEAWQQWPFNFLYQSFLLQQQWWHYATCSIHGMHPHHARLVNFLARQMLDMFSPSNFLCTNPQVLQVTVDEGGKNLWRGTEALADDLVRTWRGLPPPGTEDYGIGTRLAISPGKVIYRNRLIELIQYAPATDRVKPQPILIVPAWIMKYYILDLEPHDSLVKYLVEHGYTVFMISWKNPGPADRDLGFDDYRRLGIMAALDAVNAIVPGEAIHAVGYCIGGTLLSIAAADMARKSDNRLASMTQFAALTDFADPGELGLFIDPSQVAYLEDLMWELGYLGGARMRGVFLFLRSLDLIWSQNVQEYLMGERPKMFDLMAWNADTTNMPYRMHSEYLRRFYLNNDLALGRFDIDNEPVMLLDIRIPIFAVGTTRDHIAPWTSVYQINRLTRTETTFLLTTGGHNVGVVNPPERSHYRYQIHTRRTNDKYLSAEAFHECAEWHDGSWWPVWEAWLAERSGKPVAPPALAAPDLGYPALMDAPGRYVLESARAAQG